MSLDIAQLETSLSALYDGTLVASDNAQDARTAFVNQLAAIIDAYVRSAAIDYTGGLIAGSTPVTGTFEGNLQ